MVLQHPHQFKSIATFIDKRQWRDAEILPNCKSSPAFDQESVQMLAQTAVKLAIRVNNKVGVHLSQQKIAPKLKISQPLVNSLLEENNFLYKQHAM
uniref:Uncharacterized protein n=1 Tax=Romanomermis culicivorax TaxID=13658 RepID=A0A915ILC3_ROMCU